MDEEQQQSSPPTQSLHPIKLKLAGKFKTNNKFEITSKVFEVDGTKKRIEFADNQTAPLWVRELSASLNNMDFKVEKKTRRGRTKKTPVPAPMRKKPGPVPGTKRKTGKSPRTRKTKVVEDSKITENDDCVIIDEVKKEKKVQGKLHSIFPEFPPFVNIIPSSNVPKCGNSLLESSFFLLRSQAQTRLRKLEEMINELPTRRIELKEIDSHVNALNFLDEFEKENKNNLEYIGRLYEKQSFFEEIMKNEKFNNSDEILSFNEAVIEMEKIINLSKEGCSNSSKYFGILKNWCEKRKELINDANLEEISSHFNFFPLTASKNHYVELCEIRTQKNACQQSALWIETIYNQLETGEMLFIVMKTLQDNKLDPSKTKSDLRNMLKESLEKTNFRSFQAFKRAYYEYKRMENDSNSLEKRLSNWYEKELQIFGVSFFEITKYLWTHQWTFLRDRQ